MPTAPASTPRACAFPLKCSNIAIIPLGDGLVTSERQVDFEEKVGFEDNTLAFFSLGNVGWRRVKLPLLHNHTKDDMVKMEVRPEVVTLAKGRRAGLTFWRLQTAGQS